MLDFEFDSSITGGTIDNWYVDNDDLVNRTPITRNRLIGNFDTGTTSDFQFTESSEFHFQYPLDNSSHDSQYVEQMCNDRLKLLVKSYSESITPEFNRDIQARVLILEKMLSNQIPRYTEQDWDLLVKFQQSIDKLKRTA